MTNSNVTTQINCQQCGAVLPVETGDRFVTCEFCKTTNFVDKSRVVLHYAVRSTMRREAALAALRRWMAGNDTVKGLDEKAQIDQPAFQYFPMWMVRATQGEQERVLLRPAAALSVSELKEVSVPAADLVPYDPKLDQVAVPPSVPYDTMRQWLADDYGLKADAVREVSLVHLPIYVCKYGFDGRRFTAIVDAATSKVFANIFPVKWEMPYRIIGGAAWVAYFLAALIPLLGYATGGLGGMAAGVAIYLGIALVLAIPFFVAAAIVSAKV